MRERLFSLSHVSAGHANTRVQKRLQPLGTVRFNPFVFQFTIAPYQMTIFPDGRAIIQGTTDPGLARSLYARYIGA